ncbi:MULTISPECIES: hypothetical protein [Streptomyces]|uniref:Uncharacterized protein n=1 Tax=Streptomyces yunnanensis TaxID=156453 RepID=A0A9X8MKV7_9ACTN|nr:MULTISPECIES: hypothetical protein [Streptomyces]AJC57554.1 hypothetical protein GZL_04977 [Streptomyces sp. 769]SHK95742.1 hypothetical protein SAMN05216268_10258 [Streptomyces yunnanensis]
MYSIEMAYARMRELQDQANRSRAAQQTATPRARRRLGRAAAKKR